MYKILKNTPFGFIFELENNNSYYTDKMYDIFINDKFYLKTNKNVVSIFGLKSNTNYNVVIKGLKEDIIFNIKTEIPNYIINVKDYNALGDGISCDTAAINLAIYSAKKGSTVCIPKGVYLVNQILLKSNVNLYLEKDAVIKQNINKKDLAVLKGYEKNYDHTEAYINASWEGSPLDCYCSLIYGKEVENVHIYGNGELDGNGELGGWWINAKIKNVAYRPKNIFLVECNNIIISGLTTSNSASWNVHPFYCNNISFYNLHIKSNDTSPNTDGLNPESCENVEIIGCYFSVGDDCIAIKSGKYFMSKAHYKPTKNVIIRNCFMEKGHGGVVIGSEMSCGVQNVLVTNCYFEETDRGFRVKTRRGRGNKAIVDNIKFTNVKMNKVKHCFVINMFYNCDPDGKSDYVRNKKITIKDEETPTIKNIDITNVEATNIVGSCIFIYGLPESKVENVTIKDNKFQYADKRVNEVPAMMDDFDIIEDLGIYINNSVGVQLSNNETIGYSVNIINEE